MPSLQSGSYVGSYQIVAPIGAGGMGEVYRARDTKLKRDVAIKVLPAEFARDPERLARAQREAEVLASLNHPNIAQIYGLEESGGTPCLVLEYVDGETIQDRLRRGPIPLEEALELASQTADAFEAAHERGIIHRDLKPANVKVTPEGQVKVLDFGLAKAIEPARVEDFSQSPTLVSGATADGALLGTSAYMSPEQAKGRPADSRSDVWAFGVVLYEMLTGKSAFTGETLVEILGGVLKADPDWTALPINTPPGIRSLLRRCLQKDRKRRLRDMADARFQLEDALNEPAAPASTVIAGPSRTRERLGWAVAVVAALVVGSVAAITYVRSTSTEPPETRLQIVTPPGFNSANFAISPDGRNVVYEAITEGKSRLWLRQLETEAPQPLAGTEGASLPFWSPDSRSIGFFADGKLKRIDIGGTAQTLANAPAGMGGAWNTDGTILFTAATTAGLQRIPAAGGKPTPVTAVSPPQQVSHRFPQFLPDGRHFLFFGVGTGDGQAVYVGSLDSKETRRLFQAASKPLFLPPDHVLFVREGTLLEQRFDLKKLETVGDPISLADGVAAFQEAVGNWPVSSSAAGLLAYRTGHARRQFMWLDRSGKETGAVVSADRLQPLLMRLSPDGRTVAAGDAGALGIWLIEMARGIQERLSADPAFQLGPVWSPDSATIVFGSRRKGPFNLYQKSLKSAAPESQLLESTENLWAEDWSSDGRFILYRIRTTQTADDLRVLPLDGDRKTFAVAENESNQGHGRFSPDGHWIAFQSDENGPNQIYVQPFPGPGRKKQISTSGGTSPEWSRNGRESFYVSADQRLTAVSVTLQPNTGVVEPGAPLPLFPLRPGSEYAVAADGRFLINAPTEDSAASPITLVLNWAPRKK